MSGQEKISEIEAELQLVIDSEKNKEPSRRDNKVLLKAIELKLEIEKDKIITLEKLAKIKR